jgi:uncharacterized protein YqeY
VTLKERLQSETTAAMRSGDALRRDTLRMASNALYLLEKKERRPLSDDEELQVLSHEVKTRRESIEAFQRGGREDLASKEAAEIAILSGFLPASLSETELHALVGEAIVATGASSARDLGRVMGWLTPRTRGRADGKRLSELVAQSLAKLDLSAHDTGGGH